jgi:hypothetical protein
MLVEPTLGGDDDDVPPIVYVLQRGGAVDAALGADVVEQQHPSLQAGDLVTEAPTRPPVEERVDAHRAAQDRPGPRRQVEVARRLPHPGVAQVYIPPNMPPVTFSTWPCT